MSTMVDSKLAKSVQKSVGRAKEKILQNLGKVDRTADEIFDEHVTNFSKQQSASTRLQKELNNYIRCIRACAGASRGLLEAVNEVYEPEWGNKELLSINAQSSEMLWNDFAHRLAEQVLIPLNTYQGQFPEMRKKIEKRGRKLVDYDGERHALQALQSNPRRAEAKLARQRENLEAAKRTYEVLNSELHEELPGLYSSRIVFLVSAMSTLFSSESIFHSETSKVYSELEGIVERLSKESAKGTLNFKAPSNAILNNTDSPKEETCLKGDESPSSSSPTTPPVSNHSNAKSKETHPSSPSATTTASTPESQQSNKSKSGEHLYVNTSTTSTSSPTTTNNIKRNSSNHTPGPVLTNGGSSSVPDTTQNDSSLSNTEKTNDANNVDSSSSPTVNNKNNSPTVPLHGILNNHGPSHGDVNDSNANPSKNNSSSAPGVLYRVRATYRYQKEDVDELSFEAGEIISVVEYDDPEEQEEGWLMGVKDNGEKGMFPANFCAQIR